MVAVPARWPTRLSTKGGPIKLHAMADLFEDRLQGSLNGLKGNLADRFDQQVDVPPERQFVGFDAYKKAIDCLGPGDVVMLTTHAAFRPMHFEYAVQKGVNVFAEKSFATDGPNVRRWMKAAELARNRRTSRWASASCGGIPRRARRSSSGSTTVRSATCTRCGSTACTARCTVRAARGPATEVEFQLRHPNSFTWVSSGFFIDWHCHNIDVACWAKGAWPVSAQGMGGRCYAEAGNQFDHYTVEYTFADGAKLFGFSRHMQDCWETYADYRPRLQGLGRAS